MTASSFIIPSIVAIVVFLIYMLVVQLANRQDTTRERVKRLAGAGYNGAEGEDVTDPLRQDQDDVPARHIPRADPARLVGVDTEGFRKKSQLRFYRSGLNSPNAPIYYLFLKRVGFLFFLIALPYHLQGRHRHARA